MIHKNNKLDYYVLLTLVNFSRIGISWDETHHEKTTILGEYHFFFVQAFFQQIQDNPIGGFGWFLHGLAGWLLNGDIFSPTFLGMGVPSLASGWWGGNWWVSFGWLCWGLGKSVGLEWFVNRGWLPAPNVGILMEVRIWMHKRWIFTQKKISK